MNILWYDLETFGINSKHDNISQFAAIRTNENLEIIDKPLNFFCKPSFDKLPSPEACLITRITPEYAKKNGLTEIEFAKKIYELMLQKNTCVAGYNSIKFDDEFIRHLFFRNFCDPYLREYQFNNSRWDILDVTRLAYAIRPEGINWPEIDNKPSFKLENLTAANNIEHENAHDAISDVLATISIARLIKNNHPKLFNYMYSLRKKQAVNKLINLENPTPIIHIAPFYGADKKYLNVILPITRTDNINEIIAYDINKNIIKISLNKCPVIAPISVITKKNEERLNINLKEINETFKEIWNTEKNLEEIIENNKISYEEILDPEYNLYNGFINNDDKNICKVILGLSNQELINFSPDFKDERLIELFSRLKARNFYNLLEESHKESWLSFCREKLNKENNREINFENFFNKISLLEKDASIEEAKILESLKQYGNEIKKNLI